MRRKWDLKLISKNGEQCKVMGRGEGTRVEGREEMKGSELSWMGCSTHLGWEVDSRGRGVETPGWGGCGGGSHKVRRMSQGPRPWQEPPHPTQHHLGTAVPFEWHPRISQSVHNLCTIVCTMECVYHSPTVPQFLYLETNDKNNSDHSWAKPCFALLTSF